MAHIPEAVTDWEFTARIVRHGWFVVNEGKVRKTFLHSSHPDRLTVYATNRLSIYDFVLNALVPKKGEVLTALTHFWLTQVFPSVPNHLLLERPHRLFPARSTLVVKRLDMQDFELIFRNHLGGSVWKQYEKRGIVAGQRLPERMFRWEQLNGPLFTPSTKAREDHDVNISSQRYYSAMTQRGVHTVRTLRKLTSDAYEFARERGILILDTKYEASLNGVVGDEVLTPDSSRFTTVEDYERAVIEGRDPFFFDKQFVRQWGAQVETPFGVTGINNLSPKDSLHLAFVDNLVVPEEVLTETTRRYLRIFEMLTGMPLEQYQRKVMGIAA